MNSNVKGRCPVCSAQVELEQGVIAPHRKGSCDIAPFCSGAGQQPTVVVVGEEKPQEQIFRDLPCQVVYV